MVKVWQCQFNVAHWPLDDDVVRSDGCTWPCILYINFMSVSFFVTDVIGLLWKIIEVLQKKLLSEFSGLSPLNQEYVFMLLMFMDGIYGCLINGLDFQQVLGRFDKTIS